MQSGVYKIVNTISGKIYIGSAIDFARRKREHFSRLRSNKHKNNKLQRAFNKYGEQAFVYEPIIVCLPHDLIMYEQIAMDYYDACSGGYNIRPKAESCLGVKHSEKSKENFRRGARGRIMPPMSEESKRKKSLSAKMRGAKPPPMTEEQKERVRELTRQRMIGNKPTQEARAKMAAAKLGKKLSEETKQKMRESRLLFKAKQRGEYAN